MSICGGRAHGTEGSATRGTVGGTAQERNKQDERVIGKGLWSWMSDDQTLLALPGTFRCP